MRYVQLNSIPPPSDSRYEIASPAQGGHLKVFSIDAGQDAGVYTCIVRSRAGEEARRDMQLTVNSPPVIEPFSFPKNLQEGGRAQVIRSYGLISVIQYFESVFQEIFVE